MTMALILFSMLPFLPVFFPLGVYHESDICVAGLWISAGCAIIYYGLKEKITLSVLSFGWLAMAGLAFLGIFNNGLTSITGINDIREGLITFIAIAVLIPLWREKITSVDFPLWIFPLAYGVLTVLGFYGWRDFGWKTYFFLDLFGFALLASLLLYRDFRQKNSNSVVWDAAFISFFSFLLFYCDNKALLLACFVGLFFIFGWPMVKTYFPFLPKKDGLYVMLGVLGISIGVLCSWFFFDMLPLQLQSRTLLGIVTVLQFFDHFSLDKFFHFLFGYGWGSYQQFPVLNLFQLKHFTVFSKGAYDPNWEFLERNLLHSHNIGLETFVSSGILGVLVLAYFIYRFANNIDDKDLLGKFYWVSFLVLASAWFQMPTTIPFSILAMALIKEKSLHTVRLFKIPTCILGLIVIAFAVWDFNASINLTRFSGNDIPTAQKRIESFLQSNAHKYDRFGVQKASNAVVSQFTYSLDAFKAKDQEQYVPKLEETAIAIINDLLCAPFPAKNVVSFVHAINVCNGITTLKNNMVALSPAFHEAFKKLIIVFVSSFPARVDMTFGYLNWNFDHLQNFSEVIIVADAVLKVSPSHPVALWFKGLSGLSLGLNVQENRQFLKDAVISGLNRYMPVDPKILEALGIDNS